jgi:hypothetical protein
MASVKTAAFCFADSDRGDLAEHARWHLARIKALVISHLMSDDSLEGREGLWP